MKQYVVLVGCTVLAVAQVGAQPGPGGAGHARPADRQRATERIAPYQREELRTLIREQRDVSRDDGGAQRPLERSQHQLSPQERDLLREQLRQQRREQRVQP